MSSNDIKTHFQSWLLSKGCRGKTDQNRPSTVYEYTRRIDRLCDTLYGNHDAQNWEQLATNISSVLVSYYEGNNSEYFIDRYNIKEALKYFRNITKESQYSKYPQTKLSIISGQNEYVVSTVSFYKIEEYLGAYEFILDTMQREQDCDVDIAIGNYLFYKVGHSDIAGDFSRVCAQCDDLSFGDSVIHIEYNNRGNAKNKLVLNKYYEFLQSSSIPSVLAKLKAERNDDKVKLCLAEILNAPNNLMKCITVAEKTGKTPLQIKSHFSSGALMDKEVSSVLGIDEKTLWKLKKEKFLTPKHTQFGCFKEDDINKYLTEHFHVATIKYPNVDYSQEGEKLWCNRKQAAVIMQRTERTIFNYTSKGQLTYTDYSPQAPRYYIPELQYLGSLK